MKKVNRKNQRGAAMVEGVVIMGLMLMFLGMTLWAEKAYATKIDQMTHTRSDVLYFASHDCEVPPPADDPNATAPTFTADPSSGDVNGAAETEPPVNPASADGLAAKLGADGSKSDKVVSKGLVRHWNMVTTSREQVVSGSAAVNFQKVALTTRVKTESWVACNEKNYGGDWNDLAQFVWNMGKHGGGLLGP